MKSVTHLALVGALVLVGLTAAALSTHVADAEGEKPASAPATGPATMPAAQPVAAAAAEPEVGLAPVTGQDGYLSRDGETLYRASCQACHMADGQGAVGAGKYPALAKNANLEDPGYALSLVVNGYKAMPAFGRWMDDQQVAAVLTYVRTNFGNDYAEPVKPEDVKAVRP